MASEINTTSPHSFRHFLHYCHIPLTSGFSIYLQFYVYFLPIFLKPFICFLQPKWSTTLFQYCLLLLFCYCPSHASKYYPATLILISEKTIKPVSISVCTSFLSDVFMWGNSSRCEKKVTSEEAGDALSCILSCKNSLEHEPRQSAREHL